MKKTLYILLFSLLFIQYSFGQSFNYTEAYYHTNIANGIAVDTADQWAIIGYRGSSFVIPYVAMSGIEENTIEDYSPLLEEAGADVINMSNMVYDSTSNLYYFVIGRNGCDFGQSSKIVIFDSDETFIVQNIEASFSTGFKIDIVSGEGILMAENNGLQSFIRFYDGEQLIDLLFSNTFPIIHQIATWSTNRFVIITENELSVASYDLISESGAIENTVNIDNLVATTVLNDSTLLVLRNNGLQIRNATLELQEEVDFTNAQHLTIDEEYIYVVTSDSIHFLNHDFTEEAVIGLEAAEHYVVLGAAARNGRIGLSGSSSVGGLNSYVKAASDLFVRTYTVDGPDIPSTTDIGIESITYGDFTMEEEFEPNCMTVEVFDINVEVINLGTTHLNEVNLTYTNNGCGTFFCPVWVSKSFPFFDLNLAPGESTILHINELEARYIYSSNSFELCLKAFTPGTMEMNKLNNQSCDTITFLVDTKELIVQTDYSIYPTFCQDELTLQLSEINHNFNHISIYNLLGQKMATHALSDNELMIKIDVKGLATGSYFLRMEGVDISQTMVFVKG